MLLVTSALLFVLGIAGQTPDAKVDRIDDRFVDQQLRYDPTLSYFADISQSDPAASPIAPPRPSSARLART